MLGRVYLTTSTRSMYSVKKKLGFHMGHPIWKKYPKKGYKAGLDAILLAASVKASKGKNIYDRLPEYQQLIIFETSEQASQNPKMKTL